MTAWRLKPEAVPYFKEELAYALKEYDFWKKMGVDERAIERIDDPVISYGHLHSNEKGYASSSLSGWSSDEEKQGSHFHFTIRFPSTRHFEHDRFSNGKHIRELMNQLQYEIHQWHMQFCDKTGGAQ